MHRPFFHAVSVLLVEHWSASFSRHLIDLTTREVMASSPRQHRRHEACTLPRNGHMHHTRRPTPDDFL